MTKTRMKSTGSKKEWTGVSRYRPLSSIELAEMTQLEFGEKIKDWKNRRENFQRLRNFLITK